MIELDEFYRKMQNVKAIIEKNDSCSRTNANLLLISQLCNGNFDIVEMRGQAFSTARPAN